MTAMSTANGNSGRTAQKARTRDALVAAARQLVTSGVTPTVEQAAAAASISRATAYRYFPSARALLLAAHPEIAATTMLPENPPEDPAARLDAVVDNFTAMILETEAQQRTMLRLSLESPKPGPDALPLRSGRAIANRNTLTYVLINLRALQRRRSAVAEARPAAESVALPA